MIERIALQNYGAIDQVEWDHLGPVNLIIGENSCGKSFILKAIYTAMKTVESVGRGQNNKTAAEILADKLYWTYQTKSLGDIVKKGADKPLTYEMRFGGKSFCYHFGSSTTNTLLNVQNECENRSSNTVFIPEKEVLSICSIIRKSREQDAVFGFDDTYLDLVRAISIPTQSGNNYHAFSNGRKQLKEMIGGRVEYEPATDSWSYHCGRSTFSIGATAEGIKKISILDQLLGNRYLDNQSVLIFDEPESGVHPAAISKLMDIIWSLADAGVQVFIATHSYFVLKKAYILAMQHDRSVPLLSLSRDKEMSACSYDLRDGLPQNEIVNESVRLYQEEVNEVL